MTEFLVSFGKDHPLSDGRCLCGLCVLDTVARIADAVQNVPRRRKLLLFIGSTLILQVGPRDPQLDVGCERRVEDARQRMFDSLAGSNLTVHSLDPIGLATIGHIRAQALWAGGKGRMLPCPVASVCRPTSVICCAIRELFKFCRT